MPKAEATPRPWDWMVEMDGNVSLLSPRGKDIGFGMSGSNAELIVRAVNSHDDLVAALKEAVQSCACTIAQRDSGHLTECFVPRAKAALAKATGEAV